MLSHLRRLSCELAKSGLQFFWDVTLHSCVIESQHFGAMLYPHHQGSTDPRRILNLFKKHMLTMPIYNIKRYSNGNLTGTNICSPSWIGSLLLSITQHIVKKSTKYITVSGTIHSSVVFSKLMTYKTNYTTQLAQILT